MPSHLGPSVSDCFCTIGSGQVSDFLRGNKMLPLHASVSGGVKTSRWKFS